MDDKNRFSILLEHLLEVAEVKNYTLAKRLQYDVSLYQQMGQRPHAACQKD